MPPLTTKSRTGPGSADGVRPVLPGRWLGILLLLGGIVGLLAAAVLLVEKIELIRNPDYIPTCTINPVLSCGSVMDTPQAEAFGIPNPILGIVGFTAVTAIGAAMLAGARFAGWFWILVQAGVTFGVVFVHWLIYQSLYVIGALCPYCMIVWAAMIPIFWHITISNLQLLPVSSRTVLGRTFAGITEYRGTILTAWYLVILALIAHRFWDYWTTLI